MSLTKRVSLLGGVAVLTISGGSFADPAADATNQELRSRIADLESRLAAVEKQDGHNWLTEQRAAEVKSLVQDVLADADIRSSLLAQGMTAGYDDGAVIASAGGDFMLRTNLHIQERFMLNSSEQAGAGDDDLWGFETTRAKFILSGNVVSPEWFYKVEIETGSNNTGRTGLQDAYVGYDYGNGWKVIVGTYKAPLLREELVDSRYQLAVERSLTNYLYTGGRTNGIAVDYMGDQLHFIGSLNNGIDNTFYGGLVGGGAGAAALVSDTDFAFTVRGEWLAMGNWDQFTDFTSPSGSETGLMVGGALHYQTDEELATQLDLFVLTGDVQFEFGGANAYAAFVYANAEDTTIDVSPLAIILQGGYYFTDDWEGFARYEWSDPDGASSLTDDISIFTVGVNKYFAGHNAKWTTDIGLGLDSIGAAAAVPVTGFRADGTGEDGQVVIRSQLQIVF